ncbi:uncharacterized protein [Amphiura filiformis]|uniref:uncharacterized protein n=1 Tax=Amphiura filiformis TaxID=82378 RepID=UPI003B21AA94
MMDPSQDTDAMSGIEPLESSTATSALLQASPGSISNGKLSISFGSYHSSLQSSPKNPEHFKCRESPRGKDLDVISPLHHQQASPPQSSTLMRNLNRQFDPPPVSTSRNHPPVNHPTTTTDFSSMPNTPFTHAPLPEESKRLMASADEVMLRERSMNPSYQQNTAAPAHTKRELFTKTTQDYNSGLYRAPHSTAYTAASRSYKSYEPVSLDDKSVPYRRGVESLQHGDHLAPPQRNRSNDAAESSVKKHDPLSADTMSRNYMDKTDQYQPAHHQEIAEMERVRESLHQMLNTSLKKQDSSRSTPTDLLAGALPHQDKYQSDSLDSIKTDALLSTRPYSNDVSPLNVDSGFSLNAFKSFASNVSHDAAETAKDPTLNAENHMLRDSLEKERFRRKHCEKQIGELQSKLLETQQQLAVALSTDKKKDAMIEQLDKTLARLVAGWKKQDQEKADAMEQLKLQKETSESKLQELQKLCSKQTTEVNEMKKMLRDIENQSKQAMDEYESQVAALEQERSSVTEQLQREQRKVQELHAQHESVMDKSQRLQRELRQTQQSLVQEKEHQQTSEESLHEQMRSFEKEQMQVLNKEKARAEEQTHKAHEACQLLTAVQRDVEKLKEQLESAIREKENSQLELNLQQARFEAGQRKQEAEWQENSEKTMSQRLTECQEKAQQSEIELQESHRAQISDLQDQHQKEVDELRTVHQQEIMQREKRLETLRQQYQERLDENQEELARITNKTEDVQHEKTLLVGKLQDVLQAYYSGTLIDSETLSPSPTHPSQTSSPISKPSTVTPYIFEEPPTTTSGAHRVMEKHLPSGLNTGFGSKKDGLGELSASQIASLHTTIQLQHKHHSHQHHNQHHHHHGTPSHQHPSHRMPSSLPAAAGMLHNSSTALSEHEISHMSRINAQEDVSLLQSPSQENHKLFHDALYSGTPYNVPLQNQLQSLRERGTGVQPVKRQTEGHAGKGAGGGRFGDFSRGHQRQEEIPRLQQDPDRSFEESFVDGRGYTSGDFLPLQAVARSPTGSIVSTGPMSESLSELSTAPMHQSRSNTMLLEKLAEHEQRQLALQHYIKMLLHRSPGSQDEERNTANKPADSSIVMKERLPTFKDNLSTSNLYDQRPVLDNKPVEQQQHPVHIKPVHRSRTADAQQRHMPAERLQTKTNQGNKVSTSTTQPGNKQMTRGGGKGKTDTPSQGHQLPSVISRSSSSKPSKPSVATKAVPSRLSGKGRVTRIQASHTNDKRTGSDAVAKKRGIRGKETR